MNEDGIVIRLIKLTETSLIVTWLMKDSGMIKTVAKGARKPSSPFFTQLDLYVSAQVLWKRSRASELHLLNEIQVKHSRHELSKHYNRLVCAAYCSSLVEYFIEEDHSEPLVFDLLNRVLDYLLDREINVKSLLFYEKELLRILGMWHEDLDIEAYLLNELGEKHRLWLHRLQVLSGCK